MPLIVCDAPIVIDGDTIACANLAVHIRIMGIDAPELPGHCRSGRQCTPGDGAAASDTPARLIGSYKVKLKPVALDRYGRQLAYVRAGGRDLGCAMVAAGQAVYRYSKIRCG